MTQTTYVYTTQADLFKYLLLKLLTIFKRVAYVIDPTHTILVDLLANVFFELLFFAFMILFVF